VIGAAQSADPIREAHRRVAAVVLAAGGGTRMQGAIKQLLPVRGKPLVANAIDLAAKSAVQQIIVVLGSRAEEVRLAIHDAPAQMLINREWETGHASSVRTGLRGVSSLVDAVVFLNADQPLLTSQVIDALIQRRAETGAHIVAPRYDGMRGSPVLFDRTHFGELLRMEAEQGGRDVMALHRDEIEWVDFSDARLGFDVDTPEEYARLTTMLN
jgi:molybdenum cofactor cytidylyltransferase